MAFSWLAVRPQRRAALRLMTAGPVSTRGAGAIREDNLAAVGNSLGIDRAMSGAQSLAGAGEFRAFACPVTGDSRQDRFLARESGRRQQ